MFGAPAAHEDDPERAVRAALAIRSWVTEEQEELQVRIGINAGEAIVNLTARPAEGEGMVAGDVVNTAARLQSGAPVDGILVGAHTYEATKGAIEYQEAPPVTAKGKAEPVPVWVVRQARSRFGVDVRIARRFGDGRMVRFFRGVRAASEYVTGLWDDCIRHADEFIAECEAGSPHYLESEVRQRRAMARFARGETDEAEDDATRALELVREAKDPQLFHFVLASNVRIAAELGRFDAARALCRGPTPHRRGRRSVRRPDRARVGGRPGGCRRGPAGRLSGLEPASSLWLRASREILDEEFAQAAETFAEIGCSPDEAEARLRDAEALVHAGGRAEADAQLARALSFYRSVGATRYVRRAEQLLAETG